MLGRGAPSSCMLENIGSSISVHPCQYWPDRLFAVQNVAQSWILVLKGSL